MIRLALCAACAPLTASAAAWDAPLDPTPPECITLSEPAPDDLLIAVGAPVPITADLSADWRRFQPRTGASFVPVDWSPEWPVSTPETHEPEPPAQVPLPSAALLLLTGLGAGALLRGIRR